MLTADGIISGALLGHFRGSLWSWFQDCAEAVTLYIEICRIFRRTLIVLKLFGVRVIEVSLLEQDTIIGSG